MNKTATYMPWLPERTAFAMQHAREGLYMLDVQLGSTCNAMCPRCDSACHGRNEPADLDLDALCALASEIDYQCFTRHADHLNLPGGRNMGFICGLGEPTAEPNLRKLKEILSRTEDDDFSWSIFTNGLCWDEELVDYLRAGRLHIMLQYNSCRPDLVAKMLGVSPERAAEHLSNRVRFQNLAMALSQWHQERTGSHLTNIAASIVPERSNMDEIVALFGQCLCYDIFPLIGELENAGSAKGNYYEAHRLSNEELRILREKIEQQYGVKYETPICPATIGAIHINNRNIVTVDKFTGLSCGWFGLGEPEVHEIGDIREMSYDDINRAILDYRESRISAVRAALNGYPRSVFGGCGGNAQKLLAEYIALYD